MAAGLALGRARTVLFTAVVWAVAFAAEFSSTRTGIPFGFYTYLENTRDRELYLSNVPFMDSLSFTFLAFAAYAMALALRGPLPPGPALARSPRTLLLAALLLTLSDVIIDPLALRGDRWFLGLIYAYRREGFYFGVPFANFVGWFVVGLAVTFAIGEWALGAAGLALALVPAAALIRRVRREWL